MFKEYPNLALSMTTLSNRLGENSVFAVASTNRKLDDPGGDSESNLLSQTPAHASVVTGRLGLSLATTMGLKVGSGAALQPPLHVSEQEVQKEIHISLDSTT